MRPRAISFQQAVIFTKNWGKLVERTPGNELKGGGGLFPGDSFCLQICWPITRDEVLKTEWGAYNTYFMVHLNHVLGSNNKQQ